MCSKIDKVSQNSSWRKRRNDQAWRVIEDQRINNQAWRINKDQKYKTESREVIYLVLYWIYALHINDHYMTQKFSNIFQNDPKVKIIFKCSKTDFWKCSKLKYVFKKLVFE